jgi:hypothetical protein
VLAAHVHRGTPLIALAELPKLKGQPHLKTMRERIAKVIYVAQVRELNFIKKI